MVYKIEENHKRYKPQDDSTISFHHTSINKAEIPSTNKTGSNLNRSDIEIHIGRFDLSVDCQDKPFNQSSNSPLKIAYAGHIKGIKITGIIHNPSALKLLLLFVNTIKPTSGIKVMAGTFVNIVNPRKIPEDRSNIIFWLDMTRMSTVVGVTFSFSLVYLSFSVLLLFHLSFRYFPLDFTIIFPFDSFCFVLMPVYRANSIES